MRYLLIGLLLLAGCGGGSGSHTTICSTTQCQKDTDPSSPFYGLPCVDPKKTTCVTK